MDAQVAIADIERSLALARTSVSKLCRKADIAESTWHRWKLRGVHPRGSSWTRVKDALRQIDPELSERLPSSFREAA